MWQAECLSSLLPLMSTERELHVSAPRDHRATLLPSAHRRPRTRFLPLRWFGEEALLHLLTARCPQLVELLNDEEIGVDDLAVRSYSPTRRQRLLHALYGAAW